MSLLGHWCTLLRSMVEMSVRDNSNMHSLLSRHNRHHAGACDASTTWFSYCCMDALNCAQHVHLQPGIGCSWGLRYRMRTYIQRTSTNTIRFRLKLQLVWLLASHLMLLVVPRYPVALQLQCKIHSSQTHSAEAPTHTVLYVVMRGAEVLARAGR